ncbi:MAG: phosphate regulon transcriptional regulator PhoB [Gammaproteobacteria bacterium]|nr:phosphate regulon transcriptional regulator PhoB [Gammaproteobacteria bacterium]MCW8986772.1 phosphate regulon transcriptional regulator PhoB [Gammaproteobacteria bacterium]MCW9029882.1 phosphate regulon transcriptional regulator PhoB [Gammaproteobacteria bacterium]
MTNKNDYILVVDDERAIRDMVCMALAQELYQWEEASDAHKAESIIKQNPPQLILLDWMMPGISGIDFARKLRRMPETEHIPIIMLTAKTEEDNVIRGLESGADDYLTKPFSPRELIARIKALLRRSKQENTQDIIRVNGLMLDTGSYRVEGNGQTIELGPTEFKLLRFFMENSDRVFSREQVLNNVWGDNVYVEERTVDVHIRRLRKALEKTGLQDMVQTVRGAGYRLSNK